MSDIDWTKAPPGTNAWLEGIWHKQQGSQCFYWDAESEIWRLTRLTQYGLSIILRRPDGKNHEPTPWTGEGLPPVGVEVEWYECRQTGWQRVTVLAYHEDEAWIAPAGKPSIVVGNPANFRPIRTPEQIAEEERKAAIDEMYRIYADQPVATHNVRECLAAIYDSGWRKAGDA
ncbi:hypothetical protein [Pseudomonas sp. zfem003]|uniref:hypothetical protein n=1 Tax=Pseudomonas sp. zfem003 TaxID=3078198 RepID=UPI002927FE2E|nr:hypothetical protein [Pseudomonas sp. zfem003]MDU9398076.1 hypothetical protein [Pseudomonas sp. zfem003]